MTGSFMVDGTPAISGVHAYNIRSAFSEIYPASQMRGEASKQARDKESWIYVPPGTCAKIEGCSLKKSRPGTRRDRGRDGASIDPNSSAGIGLRSPHVPEIAATQLKLGFLEVHAENYMAGTMALERLLELLAIT
jgi:Protein of unknown function (DUF692)/Predicted integral membrane protein (DUF2282)